MGKIHPRRRRDRGGIGKRSKLIHSDFQKALWELEERATAEAYARMPDRAEDAFLDQGVWEPTGRKDRRPRRPR